MGVLKIRSWVKHAVPEPLRDAWRRRRERINMGGLRRLEPVSRNFGFERGQPVDRYYITDFMTTHATDIHGRVLEVGDNVYTTLHGMGVTQSDVLHAKSGNPKATFVADLATGDNLPSNTYDCIICTQTLMFIYDVPAAIRTLHRILKPGGVLLLTVAGISQICRWDADIWGEYWRFTSMSLRRLLEQSFRPEQVAIQTYGNVLISAAFLYGLAAPEFTIRELQASDPDYELIVAARARKMENA